MDEIKNKDPYAELGVSSKKEGVHKATKNLSKGLFPGAFCQVVPVSSVFPKEIQEKYAQVIHSDGVGTKSNVAYLAMKNGASKDILSTLPQDAIVMNTDDMACVGITNDIYISNHIARNANRVDDEALAKLIEGYSKFYEKMAALGINLYNAGGETADVGSYTTTMGIDVTASAVIDKDKVIDCDNIKPGDYIIGLASAGKSTYEDKENSGIRSNGLTLAINTLLSHVYADCSEVMDQTIDKEKLFRGKYLLDSNLKGTSLTVAEAILSPTRTYLPVLDKIFKSNIKVDGIIHCSGGGLTKSINFGQNVMYNKDNLQAIKVPAIFNEIKEIGNIDDYYMYQTFNMGIGMEIIVEPQYADEVMKIADSFHIESAVIGTVEKSNEDSNKVEIEKGKKLVYTK